MWRTPSSSIDVGQRPASPRLEESVRPLASDRPQIAERLARRGPQQVEPVALGLRRGVLVGEDVAVPGGLELEGPDARPVVRRSAPASSVDDIR